MRNTVILSGIFGLTGVLLGAFGAHALNAALLARGTRELWETAVSYQLFHAAALLGAAALARGPWTADARWLRRAAACWSTAIPLFSGSLYALALGGRPALFGPVTPLGGAAFLAGWACLILHGAVCPGKGSGGPP